MNRESCHSLYIQSPSIFDVARPDQNSNLVRMGSTFDGGYLVSHELNATAEFLVSLGYGFDSQFERNFVNKGNGAVFFDDVSSNVFYLRTMYNQVFKHAIKSLATLRINKAFNSGWNRPFWDWIKLITNRRITYYNNRIVNTPTSKFEISLSDVLGKFLKPKLVNLVKIDIEGSEYDLMDQIFDYSYLIAGLIIEFHDIDENQDKFTNFIEMLKKNFRIDHLHVNNFRLPIDGKISTAEFSFTNFKLLDGETASPVLSSFHELDSPNCPDVPQVFLVFESNPR